MKNAVTRAVYQPACLLATIILTPGSAIADTHAADTWKGEAQLGIVSTSGNSDASTINIGIDTVRTTGGGKIKLGFSALRSEKDSVLDAERYEARAELERTIDEKSFWNASARVEDDKFSAFDFQSALAVGYGRILIDNDEHELKATAGVGYRFSEAADTGESNSEAIFRGDADYVWKITEHSKLSNSFLVEAGSDNTYLANVSALTTNVSEKISMKLGFEVRHNTEAGPGLEKTDTLTTVNLVYGF